MRDLEATNDNKLIINDARSGTEIELNYRMPTTQEEVDYQNRSMVRKGKKFLVNTKVKIQAALDIITGFRDGDFGAGGKPISADPGSQNYREDWKDLLEKNAVDILIVFATTVFDGARADIGSIEVEAITGEGEDIPPLSKS